MVIRGLETERKILHLNLVVTSNVHLIKYGRKSHNKILWKVHKSDHEAILETLKCRANLVGSLDWVGREEQRERVINSKIQIQCSNLSPKTVHMTRWKLLLCVSDEISLNHRFYVEICLESRYIIWIYIRFFNRTHF